MALTLSETAKNTERQLPEAGATVGVLFSLVDLGTQKVSWDGEEKWTPKLRLAFELPEQTIEGEVMENGKTTKVTKPMVVSIELTRSLGERATLRKHLETWRGQAFTSKELASFNLRNLLGKACLLTLVHKTSQAGRNYCAIQGIAKLPKSMKAPAKTENAHIFYEIEQGEGGQFSELPEWLQEKIRSSKEFSGASSAPKVGAADNTDGDGNPMPF
ncbi:MAG: hypothetical protein EBR82_67395 [Caulobacteraceae bacterium]|nr:hypothetical protein [Caulobacteraceae bacterium]